MNLEQSLLDVSLVHLVLQPAVMPPLLRLLLGQEAGPDLQLPADAPALLLPLRLPDQAGGGHLLAGPPVQEGLQRSTTRARLLEALRDSVH